MVNDRQSGHFMKSFFQIEKLITYTPDGENILRFFFIFFYGLSQAADVDIHRAGLHECFIPLDII